MAKKANKRRSFDAEIFLGKQPNAEELYATDEVIFSQGEPADAVFYIRKGKVKQGKQAVIAILGTVAFFGEGWLNGLSLRLATALAVAESEVMGVQKTEIVRTISCSTQAKSVWHGRFFC